jgi:transposase
VPPQSAIGVAINYTLKQWDYLKEYVDYGEVEIDNNWVENQIRPLALGKKNWLFVLHERSAQIGALYYSLIQSAKLNNLNPRIYLHYLLTQVHALRKNEIEAKDLLPHRINRQKLDTFAESEFQKSKTLFATFAR